MVGFFWDFWLPSTPSRLGMLPMRMWLKRPGGFGLRSFDSRIRAACPARGGVSGFRVSGPISHHSWDFSRTRNIDSNKSAGLNKGDMLGFQEDIIRIVSCFFVWNLLIQECFDRPGIYRLSQGPKLKLETSFQGIGVTSQIRY